MDNQQLEKYAEVANQLLKDNYAENYSVEDVEKLAASLIQIDMEKAAEAEHVEELVKLAQAQARGFADEFYNTFEKEAAAKILQDVVKWMKSQFGKVDWNKALNTLKSKAGSVKDAAKSAKSYVEKQVKSMKK